MISEGQIRKDMEGSGHGVIKRCYLGICLEELRKNTKTSVRITGLWAEI
jgi:hypothetical protein